MKLRKLITKWLRDRHIYTQSVFGNKVVNWGERPDCSHLSEVQLDELYNSYLHWKKSGIMKFPERAMSYDRFLREIKGWYYPINERSNTDFIMGEKK